MYTLTKKFRFESAHRLGHGYKGKCRNLHGHSWNGMIGVSVPGLDEYQMALDFGVMGEFVKIVEKNLDHKILLDTKDPENAELIKLCQLHDWKVVPTNGNPTCEVIAEQLYRDLEIFISGKNIPGCQVAFVSIEETCTTSCVYKKA